MQNFNRVKQVIENEAPAVRFSAHGRYERVFESFDDYLAAGGRVEVNVPLILRCPLCDRNHVADARVENTGDERIVVFDLEDGAADRNDAPFTVGTCPDCGSDVRNIDYNEGPGSPEAGWKHYECPECGTGVRPERFETVI